MLGQQSTKITLCLACRPDLQYVAMMRKGENATETVQSAVADLWLKGAAVTWQAPPVTGTEPGKHTSHQVISCSEFPTL